MVDMDGKGTSMSKPIELLAKKPNAGHIALAVSAAVGTVAIARYFSARKVNGAERLAEALIDTDSLKEAAQKLPDASEAVLAGCATYLIRVAYRAAAGQGAATGLEDPIGNSRTLSHSYSKAIATVLTESHSPDHMLTYAVMIPDVGEVRGTRRVGSMKISGLSPARPAPDVAQISLKDDYTAQLESAFEIADYLVTGRTRLFGTAMLRDNRGNVGRVHIGFDGAVTGTITREAKVIGRFEGSLADGARFRQYDTTPVLPTTPADPTPDEML